MTAQPVDILLTNATVVTMNPKKDVIFAGAIAINKDTIIEVGPATALNKKYQAAKTIDCRGDIVSPGLVNAHTHVPMTLLRGLSDDLRLDVWLYGFMMPVEREFVTPEFSYLGTLLASAEMIRSGITTFCDMYYFEDQVAEAAAKAGMRAICGQTILKFPSPDASSYDDSLEYCRQFVKKWRGHPLIVPAVAPHAPYTATPEMLTACAALALEYDVPLHIHVAETAMEQENNKTEHGATVVPWLQKHNIFKPKTIAAHCVHLDDTEMITLKNTGTGVAHCPSSNLKLASGVAPVHKMLKLGLRVGIGTDGPASNNDLDMLEETRLAAFLQKGIFADPTLLPAKKAWELATSGGAEAIHMGHLIGSLETGKKADIIVINVKGTHQTPRFSHSEDTIYSQLVYAAKSTDVCHVLINGRLLMEDSALLTLDEADLHQKAIAMSEKIDTFIRTREKDLLSKLLAISSGVVPVETFEIQSKVRIDDIAAIEAKLGELNAVTINRTSVRKQYDTYFCFEDKTLGRIRYREDELTANDGTPDVLYRISLIGPAVERVFNHSIILTRSRYSVPADKSRRFYYEYFQPDQKIEIAKTRKRYHITFRNTHFAANLDSLADIGRSYLEVKSRTWSAKDAEEKAQLMGELFLLLGIDPSQKETLTEYIDLAQE